MLLYNSATHKKETFTTHIPGRVEMYTCGPTVYHFAQRPYLSLSPVPVCSANCALSSFAGDYCDGLRLMNL